jgi:hypothetical protein
MKKINHVEYPEMLKLKSYEELYGIMKDAAEALRAFPDNENSGFYQDEINYCYNELNRRQKNK